MGQERVQEPEQVRTPEPVRGRESEPRQEPESARESQPELLDAATFAARAGARDDFRWVDAGTPISVDVARVSGQGSWWWLLLAALGCLVAENVVLARSNREAVSAGGAT